MYVYNDTLKNRGRRGKEGGEKRKLFFTLTKCQLESPSATTHVLKGSSPTNTKAWIERGCRRGHSLGLKHRLLITRRKGKLIQMTKLSSPSNGTNLQYVSPDIPHVVFLPEMFHLNLSTRTMRQEQIAGHIQEYWLGLCKTEMS